MAKKEFTYRGLTMDELIALSDNEFIELLPARQRRSMKRGDLEPHKKLLKDIRKGKKNIKTHCRNFIILPEMVDKVIKVHNGKAFLDIMIQPEMVGHYLGEFALTRHKVSHSAPGVGATRSSSAVSVR
ncbi:MAG: 30S ribosomal protein S19 [Nanoarchaeota archaeon]|nr:30S ribosomal protein S19 [Nanoarchaeota archaeon]